MMCPSCNAACEEDGICEDCGSSESDFGSEPTAVATDSQAMSTIPGRSQQTMDSSQEMSVDVTLPGTPAPDPRAPRGEAAAASRALPKQQNAGNTAIALSSSMIGEELGSYRLVDVLGEGGMGRVYLAEHMKIGRRVALKMLHSHLSRNPTVVRRFFDEARAVNRILHEHIVEITDFIENDGGDNYFIMEYLRGEPLTDLLDRQRGSLTLARSLSIGVQVASALAAVHTANIVHRDLKPENIFLTERGGQKDFVKLLDFGIAKLMSDNGDGLNLRATEAGVIMGTPAFMSPEQASAKPVDHRTDIYALGVILYELCTGTLPFIADNFGDIVVMHKTVEPVRPSKVPGLMQEIPEPLDELILHCLAKKPEDRPQTAKEVEERLHEIAWEFAVELENFDVSGGFLGRKPRGGGATTKIVAGLGVAAAAVAVFALLSGGGSSGTASSPQQAVVAAIPQAPLPPDAAPALVEPAEIALKFSSAPLGATVYRASEPEEPLGVTPFTLRIAPSEESGLFEFRKEGFTVATQEISLTEGGTLTAMLAAAPVVKSSESKKARSKRRRKDTSADKKRAKQDGKTKDGKTKDGKKQNYREGAVIDPFAN